MGGVRAKFSRLARVSVFLRQLSDYARLPLGHIGAVCARGGPVIDWIKASVCRRYETTSAFEDCGFRSRRPERGYHWSFHFLDSHHGAMAAAFYRRPSGRTKSARLHFKRHKWQTSFTLRIVVATDSRSDQFTEGRVIDLLPWLLVTCVPLRVTEHSKKSPTVSRSRYTARRNQRGSPGDEPHDAGSSWLHIPFSFGS